jgi:RNA polymerase sigma-70 factor (ECF subfamily)
MLDRLLLGERLKDEAQLIDEAFAGGSAAFGQLVLKYQDRLYNAVAHLLGSAEDAREVTQDAFVQAFVKLETFSREAAFYTWLYRIAFNLAMSRRRRQRPMFSLDGAKEATGEEPASPLEGPSHALEREERGAQVRAALDHLSDEHRAILVLREIDGCCYETIAEILGTPVGTVRSRLHRARLELKNLLKSVVEADAG